MIKYVTELPFNDNIGAWYGLFGNLAVQIRLLVVKCGWNIFSPLALLLKPNVLVKKIRKRVFSILFILDVFILCLHGACESRSVLYEGYILQRVI